VLLLPLGACRRPIILTPLPSILALSLHTVSVSFLVVFRNLIALFVAAFEYFVQVNASFPRPAMTRLCAHRIPCIPHCA
jgi:hypothetical protein